MKRAGLLLVLICGLAFFWRLGGNGLFDLDEALYTESAREMRLSGDFVTPRVNGEPFFEKPPFIYWEAALLFRLFGTNEFVARLPSALASSLLVALLFAFGIRCFGRRAGILAACFFALSPLVLGTARQLTTDSTLDLWIACALISLFLADIAANREGDRRTSRAFLLTTGFWVACALGVLTKGLPGILIPFVVGFVYFGFTRRWQAREMLRGLLRMWIPTGILLFLVIALPWHLAAWRESGTAFVDEYIVRQHLSRFRGGDTAHKAPFWFFVPGFLVGFFPWSVFVPAALLARSRPTETEEAQEALAGEKTVQKARVLLKVWAVTVFVMFSVSGSKLISYILPMYPAAALLVGDWCARAMKRSEARRTLLGGAVVAFVLAGLLLTVLLLHAPILRLVEARTHRAIRLDEVASGAIAWATHLLIAVMLATGLFLVLVVCERRRAAFGALVAGMILFVGIAVQEGLPLLDRAFLAPLQTLAAYAGRETRSRTPLALYIGPPRRPSILFYLPDALIDGRTPSGQTLVQEMTGEGEGHAAMDRFLAANPRALILTSDTRAAWLLRHPGTTLLRSTGGWQVLSVEPPTEPLQARSR